MKNVNPVTGQPIRTYPFARLSFCFSRRVVWGAAGNGIGGLSAVYAEKDWINRKLFPSTGGISKKNVL